MLDLANTIVELVSEDDIDLETLKKVIIELAFKIQELEEN